MTEITATAKSSHIARMSKLESRMKHKYES